jgi:uncharacterized protein (TIGR00255 family)
MIKSMTGFGAMNVDTETYTLAIEIKTLNSKNLDLNTKVPYIFSDREIEVKNVLTKVLERGKINCYISYTDKRMAQDRMVINRSLVAHYYQDLLETAELLEAESEDLFRIALTMPQAYISAPPTKVNEETWQNIMQNVQETLTLCDNFRIQEGKVLYDMCKECIATIEKQLFKVEEKDPERVKSIREKMQKDVLELVNSEQFDRNRFEQELIYYIEKLDINEEKVRLKSHLNYFMETLNEATSNGKRLGFIAQEIGREINTIGSKANDAQIQQWVVIMKEELEKIKEQLNNVL